MKHNRFLTFVLLIVLSLGMLPAAAQDTPSNRVAFVSASAPINVRSRPNGAVIASLPPNMSVAVLDQNADGTWLSVALPGGKTGWVSASLVQVMESAVPADLVPITAENADQLERITDFASILSNGFAFSPDGRLLASYSWMKTIEIYDVPTKIHITTLTKHTDIVTGAAFSPDGSLMASSSWDGTVKIWNTQTWGVRAEFQGDSDGVNGVAYSPDGKLVASVAQDGLLNVWDVQRGERIQKIDLKSTRMNKVLFSPDGSKIATAGDNVNSFIRLWDVSTGAQLWQRSVGGNLHIAFSPDGSTLFVSLGGYMNIMGIDVESSKSTFTSLAGVGDASSLALSPAGDVLAIGSGSGAFSLVDAGNRQILFADDSQKILHAGSISVIFSPDGRLLATSDNDHAILLWGVHGSR